MSRYYVTLQKPEGDRLIFDGYVVDFANDLPTEEEIRKFYDDVLGPEKRGTITFMQKLYTGSSSIALPEVMQSFIGG